MPCTTILVGKKASFDGSTIVARNEDSSNGEFCPKRFVSVDPAGKTSYTSVISHLTVPLPQGGVRYTAMPNADLKEGLWEEAGFNARNVGMSATETLTTNERVLAADPLVRYDATTGTPGGIGEEDIITLVLPYVATAREGVARFGALLEQYGTYEANGVIISDVDDTIMITQAPVPWKAAYNLLFLDPKKKASVPGMSVLFTRIADLFPGAPFFYLSTSPWNVESSIRNFITDHGFPEGPLLLRDLDPRPKTFVPTGPQHKLEFAEQLMADFPDMKFILVGDDGQKDPTTYATIARRYPGRVLAIVIRELSPRESTGLASVTGVTSTQPTPVTDVPVFTGTTGSNILKTMLPYLKTVLR